MKILDFIYDNIQYIFYALVLAIFILVFISICGRDNRKCEIELYQGGIIIEKYCADEYAGWPACEKKGRAIKGLYVKFTGIACEE